MSKLSSFDLIESICDDSKTISVDPTSSPNFCCVTLGDESDLICCNKAFVNRVANSGNFTHILPCID